MAFGVHRSLLVLYAALLATPSLTVGRAISVSSPVAARDIPHAQNHLPLQRRGHNGGYPTRKTYSTLLRPVEKQQELSVEVYINGEPHWLLIDTGSSDLWLYSPEFQCLNAELEPTARSKCITGSPYLGSIDKIKGISYNETYGNNNSVSGTFGYAQVSVGGITVDKQQIAVVDRGFIVADDPVISGFMGLASNLTTTQYPTPNGASVNISAVENYTPIIQSLYNTHKINATFSLAIQRGPEAGYLAFGGLPPVNITEPFVTTKYAGIDIAGTEDPKVYYPLQPESYELNGKSFNTSYRAIVDSGTYALRFPPDMADQINAAL